MSAESQAILQAVVNDWTDVVGAIMAVAAFIVSVASYRIASRALRISEQQEQRKQPRLFLTLLDSCFENLVEGGRVYSFRLSIRNPTDSDNALALIEMHMRYLIDNDVSMTVKLTPLYIDTDAPANGNSRLIIPSRIAAHDTISGWCDFVVKPGIINGRAIEGYQIVLTDSHQIEASVEALVVREKQHAAE